MQPARYYYGLVLQLGPAFLLLKIGITGLSSTCPFTVLSMVNFYFLIEMSDASGMYTIAMF